MSEMEQQKSVLESLGLIQRVQNAKPSKKMQQCISKAYYDAVYDTYKAIFKHQLAYDFSQTGILPVEPTDPKMQETIEAARERVISKPRNVLLTVNPKPGITFQQLHTSVLKFTKKKIIVNAEWVYEIRKAPDQGLHCHILLEYSGRPADFKRSSKKLFSDICQSSNPAILNVRWVEDEDLQSKKDYLSGIKQDKKLPAVELTYAWRKKNNIQNLYSTPQETQVSLVGVRNLKTI